MEQRLYNEDSHLRQFSAIVLSVSPGDKPDTSEVLLDKTAFFPEGGGQPCDLGVLCDGSTVFPVLYVREKDGAVVHTVQGTPNVGTQIQGELDWTRRFDLMQQHSGEHMLSGILHRETGGDNVGFHLSMDTVTLDFSVPIPESVLLAAEAEVNRAIWENLPVETRVYSQPVPEYLEYRSKKALSGDVRLVTIPGIDVCACCGTHVTHTGEIGLVKVLDYMNYKGGTRIWMAAGQRALRDYSHLWSGTRAYAPLLSAKLPDAPAAVCKLYEEHEALKQTLTALRRENTALEVQLLSSTPGELWEFRDNLEPEALRHLVTALADARDALCVVFCGNDDTGYRYAAAIREGDLRDWCKAFHTACGGRGGGKGNLMQGSVTATKAEILAYRESDVRNRTAMY